jgi:hypothetical protein
MMHRFGHGHSVALGALLTLALERHALLVVVLAVGAGYLLGRGQERLRAAARQALEWARSPRPTAKRKAW